MHDEKEYIPYMRKMIGHKRMISIGLSCVIINKNNEVLLEKRRDNGLYCLPGGSIDFDETVKEGTIREVKEETGVDINDLNLLMILSGKKEELIYPNGDVTDYVDFVFYTYCDLDENDLNKKHDDESLSIHFYSLDKLPKIDEMLRGTYKPLSKIINKDFELEID